MRSAFATGILLLLSGVSAFGQTSPTAPRPGPLSDPAMACNGQYEKFCSAVTPGSGRKLLCMMSHLSQLTPACNARTQAIYKLESDLAAKRHMTVPQFMYWGQTLHERAVKSHQSYKIAPAGKAPAAASNAQPQPQPKQSSPQQN